MKKIILTFGVLALILGIASSALAYQGDATVKGPNYTEERHVAMEKAFENNDYNAWKNLMSNNNGHVLQVINQNNFAKFSQIHSLTGQGKTAEAQALRQELGLGIHNGSGVGLHNSNNQNGSGMGRHLNR